MAVHQIKRLDEYLRQLQRSPAEVEEGGPEAAAGEAKADPLALDPRKGRVARGVRVFVVGGGGVGAVGGPAHRPDVYAM